MSGSLPAHESYSRYGRITFATRHTLAACQFHLKSLGACAWPPLPGRCLWHGIFRGYLIDRIAGLFQQTRRGWAIALIAASLVFGLSHFGQGITGVIENSIDGMILGALYLRFGCNLAVSIVAHGVTDTVDFLLIFFRRCPGLH